MEICERFYSLTDEQDRVRFCLKYAQDLAKWMPLYWKKKEKEANVKKYYYLVTFTLRKDTFTQADSAEKYIHSQFKNRPALGVLEAHVVRELTQAGNPHWHVSVSTSRPLAKNRFNYYIKIFGNIDISKNKCQNLNDGLNYISKSNTPIQLV